MSLLPKMDADYVAQVPPCHDEGGTMTKWVYAFGDGKAEGKAGMKQPAGRQGRQPGGDEQSGPAGAAGPDHHHRSLHLLLRQQGKLSRRT